MVFDAIGDIGTAVPGFEKECPIAAMATVPIVVAEPTGGFVPLVEQAARVLCKEPRQFLGRRVHAIMRRLGGAAGTSGLAWPLGRRYAFLDRGLHVGSPLFLSCLRAGGEEFVPRAFGLPMRLGIAFERAADPYKGLERRCLAAGERPDQRKPEMWRFSARRCRADVARVADPGRGGRDQRSSDVIPGTASRSCL